MNSSRAVVATVLTLVTALSAGCKSKPKVSPIQGTASSGAPVEVSSATTPKAPPPTPAMQRSPKKLGVEWDDPPEWKRYKPRSAARAANYEVPLAPGDTGKAELTVFYFGAGRGGTVESNIERWVAQFSDVKEGDVVRTSQDVGGLKQYLVEIKEGSFAADMMMMGPHAGANIKPSPGQSLLGAVVETPVGPHFFKLTGPKKSILAAKPIFMKMLDGMRLPSDDGDGKGDSKSTGGASAVGDTKAVGGASPAGKGAAKGGESPVGSPH